MAAYNIYEAKMKLSSLVQRAYTGEEEVIIAKAGNAMVKLVSVDAFPEQASGAVYRKGGQNLAGWKQIPAELDEPLPDDMQRALGMME